MVGDRAGETAEHSAEENGAKPAGRRITRRDGWTDARKALFLEQLAVSGNVTLAARLIGKFPNGAYRLRNRDAAFAAAWDEAIDLGYARMETELVGHVLSAGGETAETAAGTVVVPAFDAERAMKVLSHRATLARSARRGAPTMRRATMEEVEAALLKKLRAYSVQRAKLRAKVEARAKARSE